MFIQTIVKSHKLGSGRVNVQIHPAPNAEGAFYHVTMVVANGRPPGDWTSGHLLALNLYRPLLWYSSDFNDALFSNPTSRLTTWPGDWPISQPVQWVQLDTHTPGLGLIVEGPMSDCREGVLQHFDAKFNIILWFSYSPNSRYCSTSWCCTCTIIIYSNDLDF